MHNVLSTPGIYLEPQNGHGLTLVLSSLEKNSYHLLAADSSPQPVPMPVGCS